MLKLSYLDNPNSIPFPKIKGKTKMKAIITDNHFNKEIKENVIERYSSFHFKLINFYYFARCFFSFYRSDAVE